jgi:hypothetical protein
VGYRKLRRAIKGAPRTAHCSKACRPGSGRAQCPVQLR